jgi:hypothetical protein
MAYATVADLREMLPQVAASATTDTLLQTFLDRATDIVDLALGFSFAAYGAAATAKDIRAAGGQYLELPGYKAASITKVYEVDAKGATSETTEEVLSTEYDILDDGRLYLDEGWDVGGWYRITAIWGWGAAPASIIQVALEVAVNLWRGRDRGMFSDVIGVEGGGAIGYQRALTNQQRMIIEGVRARTLGVVVA